MVPKFLLTLKIIYVMFSVLISIHGVFGEELHGSNGAVYQFDRSFNHLGAGSSGKVNWGEKKINGILTDYVAMKFEKPKSKQHSLLQHEKEIYTKLNDNQAGFPKFHDFLRDAQGNDVLITQLLGKDLSTLRHDKKYSIKTTMMIGIEVLNRLEYLHNKGIVYGDIKPDNFAIGRNSNDTATIYIFDFGLSEFYIIENEHIEPIDSGYAAGSPRYISLYGHTRSRLSQRDDIESLAYMLIKFLEGELPWNNAAEEKKICDMKSKMDIRDIAGKICTYTLSEFLLYARLMLFKETPDYNHLRGLLMAELHKHDYKNDGKYDWIKPKQ